jgi:hypothetical protein
VRRLRLRGRVANRTEAAALLQDAGDAVIVVRGQPRALVMKCPDRCGETLSINLDPRAGKAWRLYVGRARRRGVTLFPSVWRDGGCGAHFIIWDDEILWCGPWEEENREPGLDAALDERVMAACATRSGAISPTEVADQIDEIPWDVARACRRLAMAGRLERVGPVRDERYRVPEAESD